MPLQCTCIIPVYNEATRVEKVLKNISQVKEITEVICVDDGSTDNSYDTIKNKFHDVKLLKNSTNLGKSAAIKKGLLKSTGELIFMIDADITGLKPKEISLALRNMTANKTIDMIIIKRGVTPFGLKITRANIIFSGERVLYKKDLLTIFDMHPKGFELEVAINEYMIRNKKEVYWISSSSRNTFKTEKVGLIKGLWGEIKLQLELVKYIGFVNYWEQRLFFASKSLANETL